MSARPDPLPASQPLSGSDGELVSVHICTQPRLLESVLDALDQLSFPVNPQIYHDAGVARVYPDGKEERWQAVIVEAPAFSSRVEEIRESLAAHGLSPETLHVRSMLADIHADSCTEAAPEGASYSSIRYYKHLPVSGGAAAVA